MRHFLSMRMNKLLQKCIICQSHQCISIVEFKVTSSWIIVRKMLNDVVNNFLNKIFCECHKIAIHLLQTKKSERQIIGGMYSKKIYRRLGNKCIELIFCVVNRDVAINL